MLDFSNLIPQGIKDFCDSFNPNTTDIVKKDYYINREAAKDATTRSKGVAVNLASDTTFNKPVSLYIGTGGNVVVDLWGSGTGLVYKNISDGADFPRLVKKVYSTANGTTAADIIAEEI